MAEHAGAPDVAATSEKFRKLAETAGATLNDALDEKEIAITERRGLNIVMIERQENHRVKQDLKRVMEHFQSDECPRLHPGRKIGWNSWLHVMTKSVSIDRSIFGADEDDMSLIPLFLGEDQNQDKKIGESLSLGKDFKFFKGDILLYYKTVAIS